MVVASSHPVGLNLTLRLLKVRNEISNGDTLQPKLARKSNAPVGAHHPPALDLDPVLDELADDAGVPRARQPRKVDGGPRCGPASP
ncbi:hypothetical protein ACHAQH_006760 [Verticillium albo-atrum]